MRQKLILSALLMIGALGAAAWADGIPEQTIQNQHRACVETCTKTSGGETAACENACTCVDVETQKNFSAAEFTDYEQQIAANPDAPTFTPEIKAKVAAMFGACTL